MSVDKLWGAVMVVVGVLLILAVLGPLKDMWLTPPMFVMALIGGACAAVAGLLLIVGGKGAKA